MRKSRFTEEQIRLAVQQAEAGLDLTEICSKDGIGQATFYRWRTKYGALSRSELQELRELKRKKRAVEGNRGGCFLHVDNIQDTLSSL